MTRRVLWAIGIGIAFGLPALAQPALPAGTGAERPSPPPRNLMVEVRQVRAEDRQQTAAEARAQVQVRPGAGSDGAAVSGSAELSVQDRSGRDERALAQQIRVLNGRPARLSIGASQPWRVVQQVRTPAGWAWVPSTVFIERNSGMWVLPRWDGGDAVEMEVRAALAGATSPFPTGTPQAGAESVLLLRLGEWTVLAESEDSQTAQGATLLGRSTQAQTQRWRVEVRVTVP